MDDTTLLSRACKAYFRRFGERADCPSSHLNTCDPEPGGSVTVILANCNGVLAVYRYDSDRDSLRYEGVSRHYGYRPYPADLASASAWRKRGRFVRDGEEPVATATRRGEVRGRQSRQYGLYDVSQTADHRGATAPPLIRVCYPHAGVPPCESGESEPVRRFFVGPGNDFRQITKKGQHDQ